MNRTYQVITNHIFYDEQCENISYSNVNSRSNIFEPIEECEKIIREMPNPPACEFNAERALYIPVIDIMSMPNPGCFENSEFYYSVFFHELIHSTGHKSRLDRPPINIPIPFNSSEFAKEELIAELGSAMLCGYAGIKNKVINDDSIASMTDHLEGIHYDFSHVAYAMGQAERAAEYVLGRIN